MSESNNPIVLNDHERLEICGIVDFEHKGEKKSRWTKIGTAFRNKDGSFNLLFDYMPVTDATVQIRPFKDRGQDDDE